MPGFTHHQHATVTTFGHVLVGFAPGLVRAVERLCEWHARFDRCPLGAVTGYGTTFPIDRLRVAALLGFRGVEESSLDPVQTRGEPEAELGGILELALLHLASLAGSLIVLATDEFGCIRVADAYSSGSSIMPQKRNPDSLEVVKARAAAVSGLTSALRALPGRSLFGYNREQQWSKYLIMDVVREALPCFGVVRGVLDTMEVRAERMRELAGRGFLGATGLVEALCTERGLAFRAAKKLVERAVAAATDKGLDSVDGASLCAAADEAGLGLEVTHDEVVGWQDPERVLPRLSHIGGPAPEQLRAAAEAVRARLRAVL
jgi:argininosuccinate lyase